MKKIKRGYILPSAAYTLKPRQIKYYIPYDRTPRIGDAVYGVISRIGQHFTLENISGRIHNVHNGTRAVFVFGNRYAPDYYEGLVPEDTSTEVDLLARSGLVGMVKTKSALVKDPTRVKILGYLSDADGNILNTRAFPLITPKRAEKKVPRSPLILVCGTSMNSGKSMAAAACCWAISSLGYGVRASKVTGTASLKDILHMNDAGAGYYSDFTFLGLPSTYLLEQAEVINIFNTLDLKHANNPKNFWVVEFADGINQRETAMLLESPEVRGRIHRLIFCANDAFGAIGGLRLLKERFDYIPAAISGICSSSPLHIRELSEFTSIPVFDSANPDLDMIASILLSAYSKKKAMAKAA